MQGIEGQYTLRYKMQDQMNALQSLGLILLADVHIIYNLVTYQGVHPLYLDVKALACCKAVDFVGNLWLSMFCAGWFSVALVVAMLCYIRRLDMLPKKRYALHWRQASWLPLCWAQLSLPDSDMVRSQGLACWTAVTQCLSEHAGVSSVQEGAGKVCHAEEFWHAPHQCEESM